MEPKVVGIEHRLSGTVVINVELPGVADRSLSTFSRRATLGRGGGQSDPRSRRELGVPPFPRGDRARRQHARRWPPRHARSAHPPASLRRGPPRASAGKDRCRELSSPTQEGQDRSPPSKAALCVSATAPMPSSLFIPDSRMCSQERSDDVLPARSGLDAEVSTQD